MSGTGRRIRSTEVDRPSSAAGHAEGAWHESHTVYELVGGPVHVVVDDGHVELRLRRQLEPGGVQPALPLLRALGAAPDEAPDELRPRGRRQEHEERPGHGLLDL